jgi:hypothetical protein
MKTRLTSVIAAMLLGSGGTAAAQQPTVSPAGGSAEACQQMLEQLSNRITVLETNLDYVYRALAFKQGDPKPSITTAQKNAQGLYSATPGPSDAALAARVSAWEAAQEAALQRGTSP